MSYCCEDFSVDLKKCTVPDSYIWVGSGTSTCAPKKDTVTGVRGYYCPPFAAGDTELDVTFTANGHLIADTGNRGKGDCGLLFSGAIWQPDKIIRTGTYHYTADGVLLSLSVKSELIPLYRRAGFMLKLNVTNRTDRVVDLSVIPHVTMGDCGIVPLKDWDFMPPGGKGGPIRSETEEFMESSDVRITLIGKNEKSVRLQGGASQDVRYAVLFSGAGEEAGALKWHTMLHASRNAWDEKLRLAALKIPEIETDIPGLKEYYQRCLISGLVCLWSGDSFITDPFPVTSGMDGGSLCCYPWDVAGYSARTLILLLGSRMTDLLKAMLDSGIDAHKSMAPDGSGQGTCGYSYSMWSVINLYWHMVTMTGQGMELFDTIVSLFEREEQRLSQWNELKDYGQQENLLEMRSSGYEHIVPSPNAERAWCYDRLADIADCSGTYRKNHWREKAGRIRASIAANLWDTDRKWFKCLYPDGHAEYVYSIQAYDVLRMGACSREMKEALIEHLRDGKFLGRYGVSSVSKEDSYHYECNDPDWSGSGCYSGEGPELAEILWGENESELALDVLKCHFWMGTMVPYIPQEHECDRPLMPDNKRSNIISGVAGMEAVIFGMAGITPNIDKTLTIDPHPPKNGWVKLTGYRHYDSIFDIQMSAGRSIISKDKTILYDGIPKKVVV